MIQGFSDSECAAKTTGRSLRDLIQFAWRNLTLRPEMIMTMFQGQATDLYWTFNAICPSLEEYTQMINDSKLLHTGLGQCRINKTMTVETGALFRLASYLLAVNPGAALSEELIRSISKMVTLWGQYFQIRDDYMNLVDADVSQTWQLAFLLTIILPQALADVIIVQ